MRSVTFAQVQVPRPLPRECQPPVKLFSLLLFFFLLVVVGAPTLRDTLKPFTHQPVVPYSRFETALVPAAAWEKVSVVWDIYSVSYLEGGSDSELVEIAFSWTGGCLTVHVQERLEERGGGGCFVDLSYLCVYLPIFVHMRLIPPAGLWLGVGLRGVCVYMKARCACECECERVLAAGRKTGVAFWLWIWVFFFFFFFG
ncbi:hypothetical protein LZ32DRAFT_316096 [Colletotrichum eremochloae]|nr:hypothetical protein LZ32DRAFT_316096 [Colletotrichum eremochloae]